MTLLKQSTAATIKLGPFVDSTDGVTPETALTISQADIRLSKNGGAFAQSNNVAGATHDENGWYGIPLDTTDTATPGRLQVAVYEAGALPCFAEFMVVPANVYDSLIAGSDVLTADVTQILGTAVNTAAAQIGANVVTQANIDFGALQKTSLNAATPASVQNIPATGSGFTALGDARIANLDATISSRLAPAGTLATVTTLTGHTPQTGDSFARLGAPSGVSVSADIAAIEAQTDDIGVAGAGLTALGDARLANLDAAISTRATPAQVNTEVDTALADVNLDHIAGTATGIPAIVAGTYIDQMMDDGVAVYDRTTDSLQAIRDRGDAAWSAASGNPNVLVDTTIATVIDQTNFTLTAGSDIDNAYNDQAIVLYDASNNDFPSVRKVADYIGTTKTITLDSAPGFTIIMGDGVKTFVTAPGTTAPTAGQVADAVWDEAIVDHTTSTTFGGKSQKVVPSETIGDYKADVSALAIEANVQTHAAAALTAYDPPTRAEATADKAEIIEYVDKIDDATDGLTAIKAEVEGLAGAAMRGTDNAALASVCTEARLAELGAANIPADVDTVLTRLSAARAGYLDNLSGGAAALASICTEVRLAELDAANLITDVANVKADTAAILVDTADMQPKLGTPAASVSADIAAVKADSTDILIDTGTDGVVVANTSKSDYALSSASIDAVLDEVVEGTLTMRQAMRLFLSALAGKSSGGGTATLVFQDYADAKARITATVDVNGNRTAITLDGA